MARPDMNDLIAFLAVARARSFTRAAAQIGVSPSALSHAMRALEERLGVRLLTRTTRSVALTEAGERLEQSIGPRFEEIDASLAALSALRDRPAGRVRITADELSVQAVVWPKLRRLLADYPDIEVELSSETRLTDIVAERYDAGVRLGGLVARDMIAVPIGPEMRMAVVAAPSYLARRPAARTPQALTGHVCINLRLPTHGGLYAWEFEKAGQEIRVRVQGQLVVNSIGAMLQAALDGAGVAYLAEMQVQPYLDDKRLVRMLADWCPPFAGYHLYYSSRRQPLPVFTLVVEALRYRDKPDPHQGA